MAIPPTNALLSALSSLGLDGARPPASAQAIRPSAPAAAAAKPVAAPLPQAAAQQPAAPDPARPLPRGSLVNIVV